MPYNTTPSEIWVKDRRWKEVSYKAAEEQTVLTHLLNILVRTCWLLWNLCVCFNIEDIVEYIVFV